MLKSEANRTEMETEQRRFELQTNKKLQKLAIQEKEDELRKKRLADPMYRYEDDLLYPQWFKTGISLPVEQYEDYINQYSTSVAKEMNSLNSDSEEMKKKVNTSIDSIQQISYSQPVFISEWSKLDFTQRNTWKNRIVPQAKQALRDSANTAWWNRLTDTACGAGSALFSVICFGGMVKAVKDAPKEPGFAVGAAVLSAGGAYGVYSFTKSAFINDRRLVLTNRQIKTYNEFVEKFEKLD